MVTVSGIITFCMSPSDVQKVWLRRKTTINAFAGRVCNYGFLVYSFESSFFHSLNYEDFACSFQFWSFWGTSGDKIGMFENQRWRIQDGRQKGNVIDSSLIVSYNTWVKLVSSCHLELSFNSFFKQFIVITLVNIDPLVQRATFLCYHGNKHQNSSNFATKASKITCKTVVPFNHLNVSPKNG